MKRTLWASCALVLALTGCQETDPTKINNNLPTAAEGAPADKKAEEGGGLSEAKGSGFTASGKALTPDQVPAGYPVGERPTPAGKPAEAPKAEESAPAVEAPKAAALTSEELDAVKKLPAAEQAIAIKQAVCLVSGEHLGAMGTPIKVELDGKVGFLCCKGCKGDYDSDPAAAFAKLEKK